MKKILFYFVILLQIKSFSQEIGNISGKIYDSLDRGSLVGASIKILNTEYQTITDINGIFTFQKIPAGIYDLKAFFVGYNSAHLENIKVEVNKNTSVIFELTVDTIKKHRVLDSATISFAFNPTTNKNITHDDIIIEYIDSIFSYSIFGSDFFIEENVPLLHTIKYKTCRNGFFSISFQLVKNDKVISSGNFTLPLEKDWDMHISFVIKDENPMIGCYGCTGYKAFKIDEEYKNSKNDSLYIIWSGNYIQNPAIY